MCVAASLAHRTQPAGFREASFTTQDSPLSSHLVRFAVLLVDDLVDVAAAVVPVLHAATAVPVDPQHLHVDVVNDERFDIGGALGGDGIAGEFRIGRGEDGRLCVVNVGVLNKRQVAVQPATATYR